jgi:hypothetical protein
LIYDLKVNKQYTQALTPCLLLPVLVLKLVYLIPLSPYHLKQWHRLSHHNVILSSYSTFDETIKKVIEARCGGSGRYSWQSGVEIGGLKFKSSLGYTAKPYLKNKVTELEVVVHTCNQHLTV